MKQGIDWHNIATITGVMIGLGGAMFAILKGFFQTKKGCEDHQHSCRTEVCRKIEILRQEAKENREIVGDHYVEMHKILGQINGKLK